LQYITSPDPSQVIPLFIDNPTRNISPDVGTLEPTPAPVFRVGDVIPLRTGVIYDHNRNPVPDGTAVRFLFSIISESSGSTLTQIDTETVDGVSRAVYRIDRAGLLEIHAASNGNALSNLLRLELSTGASAGVTLVAPTPQPTQTFVPTPTITVSPTPQPTPTPIPPVTMGFRDWFLALLVASVSAAAAAWFGVRRAVARWGLRWALCGLIGGLVFYNYIALDLPGSESLIRQSGTMGVTLITLVGVFVGWGVGLIWRQMNVQGSRSPGERPATGPKSQSG
jgi:beta-N-acetylhexosaminidase